MLAMPKPLGSEGLLDADLAHALLDGDEHDVGDAEASDDQRECPDDPAGLAYAPEDRVKHVEQESHLVDGKVVPFRGRQAAAGAQQQAQLVYERITGDSFGGSRHHHPRTPRGGQHRLAELQRQYDRIIRIDNGNHAFPLFFQHPDHSRTASLDLDLFPDRITVAEKLLRDIVPEDSHIGPSAYLLLREIAAFGERIAHHILQSVSGDDKEGIGVVVAAVGGIAVAHNDVNHTFGERGVTGDIFEILLGDLRPLEIVPPLQRLTVLPLLLCHGKTVDIDDIAPEGLDALHDIGLERVNGTEHRHYREDADSDSEQREKSPELVGPDGEKRERGTLRNQPHHYPQLFHELFHKRLK